MLPRPSASRAPSFAVLACLSLSTCAHHGNTSEPAHSWSYNGETSPEVWSSLDDTSCGGARQSPVNIIEVDAKPIESLPDESETMAGEAHYAADTLIESVTNNGHTIQYNFPAGDNYAVYDGARFDLLQVHFHAPSEHTINGVRYPLEMHFVHKSEDEYLVYGVLAEQGEASDEFDFLARHLPVAPGETRPVGESRTFEVAADGDGTFYYYEGSLTTPPCTETVHWVVFREPMTLGADQIDQLQRLMPHENYRDTQPLNQRTIYTGVEDSL